jgi:hypothetical protein
MAPAFPRVRSKYILTLTSEDIRMHARVFHRGFALTLLALTAACADSSVAPAPASSDVLPGGAPRPLIYINEMAADKSYAEFTVTPGGGFFKMGKHGVLIPRDVICDPAKSSYGPDVWDDDCEVIREPLRMRAELREQDGREWIYFTPHVRFRPSSYPHRWVWIYMVTDAAKSGSLLTILWSPDIGLPGIDESLFDATLRTHVSPWGEFAYRRIKHFSGYNVTSGRTAVREDAAIEER